MPRGRPKKLSNYEQVKARKIRKVLADYNIARFDKMNDSNLLNIVQVDSSNKVFVSYDYHNDNLLEISRMVNEYIE